MAPPASRAWAAGLVREPLLGERLCLFVPIVRATCALKRTQLYRISLKVEGPWTAILPDDPTHGLRARAKGTKESVARVPVAGLQLNEHGHAAPILGKDNDPVSGLAPTQ